MQLHGSNAEFSENELLQAELLGHLIQSPTEEEVIRTYGNNCLPWLCARDFAVSSRGQDGIRRWALSVKGDKYLKFKRSKWRKCLELSSISDGKAK